MEQFIVFQLVLLFFTLLHIFEELGMRVEETLAKHTKVKNPRGVYLRVSSVITAICFSAPILTVLNYRAGIYITFFPILLSLINFIVHNVGWVKERKLYGTLAVGVFSTYPTLAIAIITFLYLYPLL